MANEVASLKVKGLNVEDTNGAILIYNGQNNWTTKNGWVFAGTDGAGKSRLEHMLDHMADDLSKPDHGVFTMTPNEVIDLLDEARVNIQLYQIPSVRQVTGRYMTSVDMGRVIGREGGYSSLGRNLYKLYIVVEESDSLVIITSFPGS